MTDAQQREAARQFYYRWNGKGKEDEDARSYWIEILQDVLGIDNVTKRMDFEKKVIGADGNTKRIDVYIPETHVLIEQKSLGIPLDKPQAGHNGKTPYEQAKEYDNGLPHSEKARWIVTSNFAEIWIYDMENKRPEPVKILLVDLQSKYYMLSFLVNKETKKITEEVELSKKAGELVGKIRDRFLTQYNDPLAKRTQKSLNILCVRLVFCFYAEDAGLFGAKDAFRRYLVQYAPKDMRTALIELFRTLDTPLDERADLYLSDELAAFPYVNGGLFSDENIVIPKITQEIKDTLIASSEFDWSRISPTIFGAVFESTLNPETRRAGGMHYTSIENIHKVIDPLFLDDLKEELETIRTITVPGVQKKKLDTFQDKLASLVFLDPACGSGNFLTESFLSLRRLENEVLRLKVAADRKTMTGQITFGFEEASPIRVSIHQFYGIEINDFAVAVAQTALWIAESQMLKETEDVIHAKMEFLPLKEYKGIVEGNALRINWNDVVSKEKLSYIMGNPPFVGHNLRSASQKDDISIVFGKGETESKLDYVICWYQKAIEVMETANSHIVTAFVSTNSICQGESVPAFWKQLIVEHKAEIQFAYSTFIWDSEASSKAHVHCVIVGFTHGSEKKQKKLYNGTDVAEVDHINPYIIAAPDVWLESRTNKPQGALPKMTTGSQPMDYGNFILDSEERTAMISKYPLLAKYIKPFIGAHEFLHDRIGQHSRYCLWLDKADLSEVKNIPEVKERIESVQRLRSESKIDRVKKKADLPYLFCQIRQPEHTYLVIPRHSSQARRYIPIGFMMPEIIAGDACTIIPNLGLYEFGVLTSNVHMAWVRIVCGRIKSDFRYQASVYNNFPWPHQAEKEKQRISETAQGILNARMIYSNSCLADLYDPVFMPPELRKAHQRNDAAVMAAYGMPIKETDEAACVAWLMRLYQEKVAELEKRK